MAAQTPPRDTPKRAERSQRILDAAATLILRWGYNKTTIDDIARQAGVAKGTIYLHWNTREDLFGALMRRERLAMTEDIKQRISGDSEGATLRGVLKHSALGLMQRPLLKAVLLRDMEVIGKLAHSEQASAVNAERMAGFTTYLEFLRAHGLVRTDLGLHAQVYVLSAIFMGFFMVAPFMPEGFTLSDAEMAELLAETVHRTLESARPAASDELQTIAQIFTQHLDRDMTRLEQAGEQLPGAE